MDALKRFTLAVSVLSALAMASPSLAHTGTGYGYGFDDDDDFGWAFISDHGRSISGNMGSHESERLGELQNRYDKFLYIRDKDEHYVITDDELMERGRRTIMQIQNYSKEIGEIAGAEAKFAMEKVGHEKQREQLVRKRKELEKEIDRLEARGEDTSDLERELFSVDVNIQVVTSMKQSSQLSDEERRELTERRDRASARLKKGWSKIKAEMREILDDAKERHLAKRID